MNKDNFKIAVGLTEDKARALYRKHFKNFYDFEIIRSNLTQGQAYAIKKEIREAVSPAKLSTPKSKKEFIFVLLDF